MKLRLVTATVAFAATIGPLAPAAEPPVPAAPARAQIPVDYRKLPNGLKVVLSPDHTSPTAVVAVYYNIGFRIEPRDRTGFAHLFEHLMFQGSKNLGKMEFIKLVQSNGGMLNGSTRFDFTNYFEIVPANALETALWAEADRMRGLAITQENLANQQGVVKNEVKVNVLNRPTAASPGSTCRRSRTRTGTTRTTSTATWRTSTRRRSRTPRPSSRPSTRRATPRSWWRATSSRPTAYNGSRSISAPSRRRRARRSRTSPSPARRRRSASPGRTRRRRGRRSPSPGTCRSAARPSTTRSASSSRSSRAETTAASTRLSSARAA